MYALSPNSWRALLLSIIRRGGGGGHHGGGGGGPSGILLAEDGAQLSTEAGDLLQSEP